MSRNVTKFAVFIASPGDVPAERNAAVKVLEEWNRDHSLKTGFEFEALRWDDGDLLPDIEGDGQDQINKELLARADLLIAIFWSRVGAGGTMEELATFQGQKLAYFCDRDVPQNQSKQYAKVESFKDSLMNRPRTPFMQSYTSPDEFESFFGQHANKWINQKIGKVAPPDLNFFSNPREFREILSRWLSSGQSGSIFLFNIELNSFLTESDFRETWGEALANPSLKRIVMVLPPVKRRRLLGYVGKYGEDFFQQDGSGKIEVANFPNEVGSSPPSVAFAAFRFGDTFSRGQFHDTSVFFVMSEPFSCRERTQADDPYWSHDVMLVCSRATGAPSITDLLQRYLPGKEATQLRDLLSPVYVPPIVKPGNGDQLAAFARTRDVWNQSDALARTREVWNDLFFSNVPTYVLDKNFFLMDWNASFDLVFGHCGFYRGEYVTEFLDHLENAQEVKSRGSDFVGEPPLFDDEEFVFKSPEFGRMVFLKTTAQAIDKDDGEYQGWNVALSLTSVERGELYRQRLRTVVGYETLMMAYAPCYNRIMAVFSDYQRLAEIVADAVGDAQTVLDVGSGPGYLSRILAARGKNVVAIDSNDAMLRCAYDHCSVEIANSQIEIHKANLESISKNELANVRSKPFQPPYDAVVMLNVFYAIRNKEHVLAFLRSVMKPGGILALTGPNDNVSLNRLFANVARCGPLEKDERLFQSVNRRMLAQGLLTQSVEATSKLLIEAGFEILQTDPTVFGKQGVLIVAKMIPGELDVK